MPPRHAYVHVPFCARRCSYCDFAIAVRRVVPVAEYVGALGRELALRVPAGERWTLDTLYLGGGTPSRLGGDGVRAALDLLRTRLDLAADAEVTLEANPEDVTPASVAAWRQGGVTRVSLGGQSFDERVLAWMHRGHGADAVPRAVGTLRDGGIADLSLDLIFAVPAELERDWRRDLDGALALDPPHLSLYGLTVEPGTPLGRWVDRGETAEADEEVYAREFLEAHRAATAAGLEHYEVSNFARPGRRARHNSAYWRLVPYLALGPGAHGYDGGERWWNVGAYADWVSRLERGEDPTAERETPDEASRAAERVYLGLRTSDGLALAPGEHALVAPWVAAGWAVLAGDRVRLTAEGWLRLDSLATSLTAAASPS